MPENKEPAIKLFGKTIPLQPSGGDPPAMPPCGGCGGEKEEDVPTMEATTTSESNNTSREFPDSRENSGPPKPVSSEFSFSEAPSDDKKEASTDEQTSKKLQDEPSNPKGKTLKKPDKVLPCPRCKSMDTKFCYYNNYNVNQPRHFCKNCQRYWTAGGTMRNVPVGSGRRKSKNSNPHHRFMAHPSPHAVRGDAPDMTAYPLNRNSTVLSFGSGTALWESMAPPTNFAEKNSKSSDGNGLHQMEEKMPSRHHRPPDDDDGESRMSPVNSPSSKGLKTSTCGTDVQASIASPCFSGTLLPYPWGPNFPFYAAAAAYSNCTAASGTWSTPLISPVATVPALSSCSEGTGSSSPLGKHNREGEVLKKEEASSQGRAGIWNPKTLRIHGPEEAAKSSIWALVGARSGKASAVSGGGLFKAFHQDEDTENHARSTSNFLHANPAALSRSLNFQESS